MDWQPIDTAPKDGTQVLLYERGRIDLGRYSKIRRFDHDRVTLEFEGWSVSGVVSVLRHEPAPTHWMPLPPCPVPTEAVAVPADLSGREVDQACREALRTPARDLSSAFSFSVRTA